MIWTRYSGGEDFFGFLLVGDRFFDLEGGYPLDSFTRISKIFQNFQARGHSDQTPPKTEIGFFAFLGQLKSI